MVGGAIGFMAYDAIRLFEKIPDRHEDQFSIPDLFFLFHTVHIAFDHVKGTIFISVVKELSENLEQDYLEALKKIQSLLNTLKAPLKNVQKPTCVPFQPKEDTSDAEFHEMVLKAKEHIRKGDAFQIVLSRTFSAAILRHPFEIYRALRMTNLLPSCSSCKQRSLRSPVHPPAVAQIERWQDANDADCGKPAEKWGKRLKNLIEELLQDPKETAEAHAGRLGEKRFGRRGRNRHCSSERTEKSASLFHM